ncbi:MAG: methyl-accepting chemotaxis protein [Spirochaetales bacterium]|nr:methyl-accepting chemotaxis protein [Spirochaetales bacterium]
MNSMDSARSELQYSSFGVRDSIVIELSESFELLRNIALNSLTKRVAERMNSVPAGLDNDDYRGLDEFDDLKELMSVAREGTSAELVYVAATASTGLILSGDVQLGEGFDVRKRDYYQGAFGNPGEIVISEPRVSAEETAEPKIVITAARNIPGDNNKSAGIVALNYTFDPIIQILRDFEKMLGISITLIDTAGEYVLWYENDGGAYFFDPKNIINLSQMAGALGYSTESIDNLVESIIELDTFAFDGNSPNGISINQSVHIPGTRWAMIISISREVFVREVAQTLVPPFLTFLIIFIVLQVVVYIISMRSMVRPLIRFGKRLEALSEADADLTVSVDMKRDDEIGKVADSFNRFVEKLRHLMVEVKKAIGETDSIKVNVSASTEETSASVEQISANLGSINRQIETLDNNINENVSAIEQVTRNINSVDDQIINQSAMVEESTAAITEMIASLKNVNTVAHNKRETTEELSKVAGEGKNMIDETAANFKTVVTYIDQIHEMTNSINGIASQTNLLSMNAAIEAAHAGDAGKGFAVVAEEIRKLATSAGESSQAISQLIKNITESVDQTDKNVMATSRTFEKITKEVQDTVNAFSEIEQSVAELNTGGQQILDSSNQINEATVNIRNGSGEIKSGTELMLASSTTIKEISKKVSLGMDESNRGAMEIVKTMQQMIELVQSLDRVVEELKKDFNQFRT